MKKLICLVICLVLVGGVFSGCGEGKQGMTDKEIDELIKDIDKFTAEIKEENPGQLEVFMEEHNLTLTAKDVQYDMGNNVDKSFVITGTAKLDDYYNYGFDDAMEKDFFVIRVNPSDNSDEWYLYCGRSSLEKLFNILKENSEAFIIAECKIPKSRYEEGQGNMAIAQAVVGK